MAEGSEFEGASEFFSRLTCPICKLTLCWHGNDCQKTDCWKHHCREHDHETGNKLVEHLIDDFSIGGRFTSPELLRISGLTGDARINTIVSEHISEVAESEITGYSIEYIESLTGLGHLLNIDKLILYPLKSKNPLSHWWDYAKSKQFLHESIEICNRIEQVEMPEYKNLAENSTTPVQFRNLEFRKLIQEGIHKEFHLSIRGVLDDMINSKLKFGFVGREIMHKFVDSMWKFGTPRQLAVIYEIRQRNVRLSSIVHDFDPWLVRMWVGVLRKAGRESLFAMGGENLIESLYELSEHAQGVGDLNSLFYVNGLILKRFDLGRERGPIPKEKNISIVRMNLEYWNSVEEPSNYIKNLVRLLEIGVDVRGGDFVLPHWFEEKLGNQPHLIYKFEQMRRKSGIEFDYSDMVSKLPKDTFGNFLFFKHQSDFLNPDNRIQFPENDVFNSRLVSAIMKSDTIGNADIADEAPVGFTIDLPNLIWLDTGKDRDRCVENIIQWIDSLQVPCYVHTTPNTCHWFEWVINRIYEETDAKFLYSDFGKDIDEDLHFLFFALKMNTWIVSNDGFADSENRFEPAVYKHILDSNLFPRYSIEDGFGISPFRAN